MAGFKSTTSTFRYVHPDWREGSFWTFRAEKADADEQKVADMTTKTVIGNIDRKELRRAYAAGKDVADIVRKAVSQESVMSAKHALLIHMSETEPDQAQPWGGPEFVIAGDYAHRNPKSGKVERHPLAGTLAPCDPHWVGLRDTDELDDILNDLNQIWAGRDPDEVRRFRRERADVDGPDGDGPGSGAVPGPTGGALRVLPSPAAGSDDETAGEPAE